MLSILDLPDEVIDLIFDQIRDNGTLPSREQTLAILSRTSRRLRKIAAAQLYKSLDFYENTSLLIRSLEENLSLCTFVNRVQLEELDDDDQNDYKIANLFAQGPFINLQGVDIGYTYKTELVKSILMIPGLKHLTLHMMSTPGTNQIIDLIPSVKSLHLSAKRQSMEPIDVPRILSKQVKLQSYPNNTQRHNILQNFTIDDPLMTSQVLMPCLNYLNQLPITTLCLRHISVGNDALLVGLIKSVPMLKNLEFYYTVILKEDEFFKSVSPFLTNLIDLKYYSVRFDNDVSSVYVDEAISKYLFAHAVHLERLQVLLRMPNHEATFDHFFGNILAIRPQPGLPLPGSKLRSIRLHTSWLDSQDFIRFITHRNSDLTDINMRLRVPNKTQLHQIIDTLKYTRQIKIYPNVNIHEITPDSNIVSIRM